ncbi:zinc knuckle CX2CX4HX4C containing protein [Tanacetum coccineum]
MVGNGEEKMAAMAKEKDKGIFVFSFKSLLSDVAASMKKLDAKKDSAGLKSQPMRAFRGQPSVLSGLTGADEEAELKAGNDDHTKQAFMALQMDDTYVFDNGIGKVTEIISSISNITAHTSGMAMVDTGLEDNTTRVEHMDALMGSHMEVATSYGPVAISFLGSWDYYSSNIVGPSNIPNDMYLKATLPDDGAIPSQDTLIVHSASINLNPGSYARAAGVRSSEPKKGKANFRTSKSKNLCEGVELTIPIQVVQTIINRFENTLYGHFIGKRIAFSLDSKEGLKDVLENKPWMIRNSSIIIKKWTMSTSLFKEELTRIPVWVKLHDVTLQVFTEDDISLIVTQIGKPIILDSFTSSMCIDSWGQINFARCLNEVKANEVLKDSITMGIPLPKGSGFSKETVRVEYEWKPSRCEQYGFQMVVNKCKIGKTCSTNTNRSGFTVGKATWQPIKPKIIFEPKAHGNLPKNGAPNVSIYAKDGPSIVLTSSKE